MRVLCCPLELQPETREALENYAPDAEIVWIERGDPYAYWRHIKQRWHGPDSLLIIEHDMVFTDVHIESMRQCDKPWCGFMYKHRPIQRPTQPYLTMTLGFTRFSGLLMDSLSPNEISVSRKGLPPSPEGDIFWPVVDQAVRTALGERGVPWHDHGVVGHNPVAYPGKYDREIVKGDL